MRAVTVVTARLGSSRLPGKMLLPLGGRPVLEHVVRRLSAAHLPEQLVVATTQGPRDDVLADAAEALGVAVFRGSSEDILKRWLGVAESFDADLLVTCDGDDVLCDVASIDHIVEEFDATRADYITCAGLPFGMAPAGVSRSGLARVCARKVEANTEGQGRFFADPALTSTVQITAPAHLNLPQARLTLDYPEDLEFFEQLIEALSPEGSCASSSRIVEVLRSRPDLIRINAGRQAEYWERFNERYPPVTFQTS